MDECKKVIDLTEEEEEELQNEEPEVVDIEEPEEEMEQNEEEQEEEEQEIESPGKPPASAAVACTPFYNAVLGVWQIVHPSGLGWKLPFPSTSSPKTSCSHSCAEEEVCCQGSYLHISL